MTKFFLHPTITYYVHVNIFLYSTFFSTENNNSKVYAMQKWWEKAWQFFFNKKKTPRERSHREKLGRELGLAYNFIHFWANDEPFSSIPHEACIQY
jgi:hypothetical protein